MDIKTNTITIGDQKIFMQVFLLDNQKFFYFSDNNLKFSNLACNLYTGEEILSKEVIADDAELVNSFLHNFHKFLSKKFEQPIFASFNFSLKGNDEYIEFIQKAKEIVTTLGNWFVPPIFLYSF